MLDFLDVILEKLNRWYRICKLYALSFYRKKIMPYLGLVHDKIDWFQRKYLHKGELKRFVIVRYVCKELLLYFGVSFLFFFMIF